MKVIDQMSHSRRTKFFVGRPPADITPEMEDFMIRSLHPISDFDPNDNKTSLMFGTGKLWLARTLAEVKAVCPEEDRVLILFGSGAHQVPTGKWKQKSIFMTRLQEELDTPICTISEEAEWEVENLTCSMVMMQALDSKNSWKLDVSNTLELKNTLLSGSLQFSSAQKVRIHRVGLYQANLISSKVGSVLIQWSRIYQSQVRIQNCSACTIERTFAKETELFLSNATDVHFHGNSFCSETLQIRFSGDCRVYAFSNKFQLHLTAELCYMSDFLDSWKEKIQEEQGKRQEKRKEKRKESNLSEEKQREIDERDRKSHQVAEQFRTEIPEADVGGFIVGINFQIQSPQEKEEATEAAETEATEAEAAEAEAKTAETEAKTAETEAAEAKTAETKAEAKEAEAKEKKEEAKFDFYRALFKVDDSSVLTLSKNKYEWIDCRPLVEMGGKLLELEEDVETLQTLKKPSVVHASGSVSSQTVSLSDFKLEDLITFRKAKYQKSIHFYAM